MREARWIVDETTGFLTYMQGDSELDYVSRRSMHQGGYDALVTAVRKAQRWDEAAEIAASIEEYGPEQYGKHAYGLLRLFRETS